MGGSYMDPPADLSLVGAIRRVVVDHHAHHLIVDDMNLKTAVEALMCTDAE